MVRKIATLFAAVMIIVSCYGQITVNQADMPSPGDTVRLSIAAGLGGIDPTLTGQGYIWDYSSLSPMSQAIDSFVSVSSTPFIYQLIFNSPVDPNKATLAQKLSLLEFFPGISLSDVYAFNRSTSTQYSFVGYAGEFSGIPLPAKFSSPDILYNFPMQYGNADSATAILDFSLPGMGAIFIQRYRRNFVDGYGTLITPFGSHQVLKLRSVVIEYDSVYLDTLGQGFAIPRNYTEYKWIGKGFDQPLLQITEEGALQTIRYVDSIRATNPGIAEHNMLSLSLNLWPNPASQGVNLSFKTLEGGQAFVCIYDMTGREVAAKTLGHFTPGNHQVLLDADFLPIRAGNFLLRLSFPEGTASSMLVRH